MERALLVRLVVKIKEMVLSLRCYVTWFDVMRLFSVWSLLSLFVLCVGTAAPSFAKTACPADQDKVWHDCIGVYEPGASSEFNGDIYRGYFKDDTFHGLGGYFYEAGDVYFGGYDEGALQGAAIYVYGPETEHFGDSYIGNFDNGQRNGHGAYFFADGDIFVGTFEDGRREGAGTYYFADGTVEHGIWRNGKFTDAMTSSESRKRDCPKSPSAYFDNCFGIFEFDGGDKYVGEFKDDDFHGLGTYIFPDGDVFRGYFQNGKWNGLGLYMFGSTGTAKGDVQLGVYRDGSINGEGVYLFNSDGEWAGDIFAGNHKDGLAEGLGAYFYSDGAKFIGLYGDDVRNGPGTLYFADGTNKAGIWKDGEMQSSDNAIAGNDSDDSNNAPVPDASSDAVVSASSGSGFAVSNDGFIVTNHHVIDSCQEVYIHHEGQKYPATTVTYDPNNDLALLKADFAPAEVLPLADTPPELLQDIYVAGYPFGMGISSTVKVTKGIISSLTGVGNNFSEVQIDAALQSGNSGGPIVDEAGNVIGVAVAKLDVRYALDNFGAIPENTNFGIKSSVVRSILDSNTVNRPAANATAVSKTDLGRKISRGTFYISCWMTRAQIDAMKSQKVMFDDLR